MQLTCPHCRAAWELPDRRPSFCPFCGKSLPPDAPTESFPTPALPASEASTVAATPRAPGDDSDPATIGGYRLMRVLGVGGMGKVYEAEDPHSGRRVALKLVSAEYAASASAVERFRQEGRLASLIAHPRCVFVVAADEEAGRPYIVMELMPGANLDDFIRKNGPQRSDKAVRMILDVIEGLQEAHRVGVVHRDVKPSNCFFGDDGRLKVGDFGLSKSLGPSSHLTKTGSFLGTPAYASPEQVRGETVDAQSDVYSTAATLYYVLTGRAPFQSENAAVTLARIAADPAPSMRTLRPELSAELDRVVLRGLERNRSVRWQNLEELADALRPFLLSRSTILNLGVRFGAFAIDYVLLGVLDYVLEFAPIVVGLYDPLDPKSAAAFVYPAHVIRLVVWFLYFGLTEGLLGWSPGKWLVGLRVRNAATGKRPGLGRGLLRSCLAVFLLHLGAIVTSFILVPLFQAPLAAKPEEAPAHLGALMLVSFSSLGLWLAGLALMFCTMRPRNGYRGLHDLASGTAVVPLPRRAAWAVAVIPPNQVLSRTSDVPEKIGPFTVRGAFRSDEHVKVLLGLDETLGRQVVLWLCPADEPPLTDARRQLNRTTRLRWLAAGRTDGAQWDAFVAPGGSSLPALVAANGRLAWPQVQPLLKQLADEMLQALKEDTLPPRLGLEQVWVQPDGRVVLLDTPFTPPPPDAAAEKPAEDMPEKQSLDLLGRVAVLALEGRRSPPELPPSVRAPLPLPAHEALEKLLNCATTAYRLRAFRELLEWLQDKPVAVTRGRRAGQLALTTLFLLLAGGCCLSPLTTFVTHAMWIGAARARIDRDEQAVEDLETAGLVDALLVDLNTDVPGGPLIRPDREKARAKDEPVLRRLDGDKKQTQKKVQERADWGGLYARAIVKSQEPYAEQRAAIRRLTGPQATNPAQLRKRAENAAESMETPLVEDIAEQWTSEVGFVGPVLWVLWALLTRGGLSYQMTRIALVTGDGRQAGRFRCLWRSFLVWAPFTLMLFVAHRLDEWYWSVWGTDAAQRWALWTSLVLWWAAWLLVTAYLILALRNPTRTPLDRLAGTYLVPR
jgi:hypothetical protein